MRLAAGFRRSGFTAIELVLVLAIILVMMGIAGPPVVKAVRRATVRDTSGAIMEAWKQARILAMTRIPQAASAGAALPHYGIAVVQDGNRIRVGIIYDTVATISGATLDGALMRAGVWDAAAERLDFKNAAQRPTNHRSFDGNVVLSSVPAGGSYPGGLDAGDQGILLYAQYRTGVPVDPARVAAGTAGSAPAVGLGVPGSTLLERLVVSTTDFVPGQAKGYGVGVSIYHVGVTASEELP